MQRHLVRPALSTSVRQCLSRGVKYQPFDSGHDEADLAEARTWHRDFNEDSLPKGKTTFSRSSGPGGQHVNKTETKATTLWPLAMLEPVVPRVLQQALRRSRYYVPGSDGLAVSAQTERSRAANTGSARRRLAEELRRIYDEVVPGEESEGARGKWEGIEKESREKRLRDKRLHSSKKQSRRDDSE